MDDGNRTCDEGTTTDVVIAGAGPVGLTLALALARRGVRTTVLERKDALDPHSRATLLPPRALEVLAAVGVLPAIVAGGQVNPALDIRRAGDHRRLLRFDFAAAAATTAVPFAVAIPQDRTERTLLDATGRTDLVQVRFGDPLERFTDHGDRVEVRTRSGARLTTRYLVGCDGAHSAVRERLGWVLEGRTYPTRAFLADVDVAPEHDLPGGWWLADPGATSFTLAVRFGGDEHGGRWRIIESAVSDDVAEATFADRARTLTETVLGAGAWRGTRWTAAYRKHERRAERYHLGRVVLAGDAVHLNSPADGQGLGTGLQDAHALGWRLARLTAGVGDPEVLLTSYTQERTQAFDADVRPITSGIEQMETLPPWVRSTAFAAVGLLRRTGLPAAVTRRLAMLTPTPVRSALVRGTGPAGRRLPDVPLPDGRRLYELFGPAGLLLSDRPDTEDALPGLPVVTTPESLPAPFAGHGRLLVRPDHVVAAAGADVDATARAGTARPAARGPSGAQRTDGPEGSVLSR